jgi:hypothetical protein
MQPSSLAVDQIAVTVLAHRAAPSPSAPAGARRRRARARARPTPRRRRAGSRWWCSRCRPSEGAIRVGPRSEAKAKGFLCPETLSRLTASRDSGRGGVGPFRFVALHTSRRRWYRRRRSLRVTGHGRGRPCRSTVIWLILARCDFWQGATWPNARPTGSPCQTMRPRAGAGCPRSHARPAAR